MARVNMEADLPWEICKEPGCCGARAADERACLAHLEHEDLRSALGNLDRAAPVDARGVEIDDALLSRVLDALDVEGGKRRIGRPARFDRATFRGDIRFDGVEFGREVWFDGARFEGRASFQGTSFRSHARFAEADFEGPAGFGDATFNGQAWFTAATFGRPASFQRAAFRGPAWFRQVTFQTDVEFDHATFSGDASFDEVAFRCHSLFAGTVFEREARFASAAFAHQGHFAGASFRGAGGAPRAVARQANWSGATLAPWGKRAAGALVDLSVPVGIVASAAALAVAGRVLQYHVLLPLFLALGAVGAVAFTLRNLVNQGHTGQTMGKVRLGLCLVREHDGFPVGPGPSVARQALHGLDTVPMLLGWLWPLWDEKRQTFADKICSSVVVVSRGWDRPGSSDLPMGEGPAPGGG